MALTAKSTMTARCSASVRGLTAPLRPVALRRAVKPVAAAQDSWKSKVSETAKALSLSAVPSSLMMAGHAQAASELSQLAASDNRFGTIGLLFLPALGWVGFNILQPALNQLGRMDELNASAKPSGGKSAARRALAAGVGLSAALSLLAVHSADAASEVSQLAAGDNRFGTIGLLFLPALGWVGFNILQPALNQLGRMDELNASAKPSGGKIAARRAVAAGVGLGAALSLLAAQSADAASEVSQLAAGDNRFGTIGLLFLPALAWVGFNILQPALNQLGRMDELNASAKPATASKRR